MNSWKDADVKVLTKLHNPRLKDGDNEEWHMGFIQRIIFRISEPFRFDYRFKIKTEKNTILLITKTLRR
jgi:hypothetical protein